MESSGLTLHPRFSQVPAQAGLLGIAGVGARVLITPPIGRLWTRVPIVAMVTGGARDGESDLRIRLTGLAVALLTVGALGAQTAAADVPGSFAPTGDMTAPRLSAAAAPLPDGRVLVAGGLDPTQVEHYPTVLQSAEIFDPATETFSPTGSMAIPRLNAAAAPLPDGRVLVAGGSNQDHDSLQSAEIFDPATGTFAPTGDLTVKRDGPAAAAPLPDGRVLVAGGFGPLPLPSAEIFDPATGTFAPTGDLGVTRGSAAAAPLPDGRVLIGGGTLNTVAEIFDPATGTFAATGSMTRPRYDAAAATLSDGRVLVAGTALSYGPEALLGPRTAELFTPGLSYRLEGTKLTVPVAVAGTLRAAGATTPRGGAATAARKRRALLKPTSAQGGPRPITLKLRLTTKGKRRLEREGKLKVRAKLGFAPAPVRGDCVTVFSPCYSSGYAISQTATLTLKAKKRR
jgi:Kelch motif